MTHAPRTLGRLTTIALAAAFLAPARLSLAVAPKARAAPRVIAIFAQPPALTFVSNRDARTLIVTGKTAAGNLIDLSSIARFHPGQPIIRRDADGFFQPVRAGRTTLIITAAGQRAGVPIVVKSVASPPVSFVREVEPIIGKIGCNAGTCHGAARGKNGFKLSLRGYDPDFDYHALIDDVSGRRFNRSDPAQSLMLLKPTETVPHMGGRVLIPGSRQYLLLRRWIAEGVRSDVAHTARVASLQVLPATPHVTLPGMTQKVVVIAHYPDGSSRDVTREAVLTSSQPDIATVDKDDGHVTAIRRGEAALLVRYDGQYATNAITVLGDRTGYRWAATPEFNYIDKLVDQKLRKIKALASGVCDDATFLRRVSLDLTGLPPAAETVRAFLSDRTPMHAKRARVVDELMQSPAFDERWTNKWADLLDCNSKYLGDAGVRKFHAWIHDAVAHNVPYNRFVHELITASGDAYAHPAANYMRVLRDPDTATEDLTQLFLGVRFSCCKCHDHPFERWTQNQYYQIGAFFAHTDFKAASRPGDEVVYDGDTGDVMSPKTGLAVSPVAPVGPSLRTAELRVSRRDAFADWLTSTANPYFSRAIVNRVWSYFLGRGIIDPVDDIRSSNPASNTPLLEALNADFVRHGFDLKHLMRTIVLSRVYQATITSNRWNDDDTTNFSHYIPRRLDAEELLDAISQATGTHATFDGMPAGTDATDLPDASMSGANGFLDLFGRPARQTPCECERSTNVSLGQALSLINGTTLYDAIHDPNGRLARLMKSNPAQAQIVDNVFLSCLCRFPTGKERTESIRYINESHDKLQGAQDLMWALINSPAFLFDR